MFFDKVGKMALGSRLRMLSEMVTDDAANIYDMYDVSIKPKWFPVFYVLSAHQEKSITEIAEEIGHSHPSVSKIVKEMCKGGIAVERKDKADGRRNIIALTAKGIRISKKTTAQYEDVEEAVDKALQQTQHNLWKAMEEFEFLLKKQSLLERVKEAKKKRESAQVAIISFEAKYAEAFKTLNESWIRAYFKMEQADYKALDNPQSYIIDPGGHILIAMHNNTVVGVCALQKNQFYDFELAKMAVASKAQGLGIGWKLGNAIIDKARTEGAKQIYIESNTKLEAAINLYYKLGFRKVSGNPTPYERCNIQLVLDL